LHKDKPKPNEGVMQKTKKKEKKRKVCGTDASGKKEKRGASKI